MHLTHLDLCHRVDNGIQARWRWFNLTIENVRPFGSGVYTCVAQNEGGMAKGKVTVLYNETVATNRNMNRFIYGVLVLLGQTVDVIMNISLKNPFYISHSEFGLDTSRSFQEHLYQNLYK